MRRESVTPALALLGRGRSESAEGYAKDSTM